MKNKIILSIAAAFLMLAAGSLACILTSRVFNSVTSFRNTQPTLEIAAPVPTQAQTQQFQISQTSNPQLLKQLLSQ